MADIAQLGISVDSSQAKLAAKELDNLAAAGAKAEGSVERMGKGAKRSLSEIASSTQAAQQAMQRMADAQERQEKLLQQMSRQMDELTKALQGNATANNAAAQAAQNAAQALGSQASAAQSAAAGANNAGTASRKMAGDAYAAGDAMGSLATRIAAAATAALSLNKAITDMDAWTNMNNRIKLVTETQAEFVRAQTNIIHIANSTRQPLAETAELYQRLASNQKALGLSGGELAGVIKTISQSMVIGGSSAASGAAALGQLGQAFNSGLLRGQEFNSVLEQAPGLMQAIAAGMGKTVGEMRALAEAEKLTSEAVVKALQAQASTVNEKFGTMASTIAGAGTVFNNQLREAIGRMDEAVGASSALAGGIKFLGDNLGAAATVAGTLAAVGLVTWFTGVTTAAGGTAAVFTAVGVAARGMLSAIGPAGWLILGLGAAATAWQLMGDKAQQSGIQMDGAAGAAKAAGDKLVAGITPAINTAIAAYDKLIEKQRQALGTAASPLQDVAKGIKEADLNLQKLAQQVARAQRGVGEYVNMGPTQRAAAEKALTTALEAASKKRAELAAKEVEYNKNVVASYVSKEDRLTEAELKAQKRDKAREARDKALEAAGADRVAQERINAAYRTEIAKIEEDASKKGASAAKAAAREVAQAEKDKQKAQSDAENLQRTYYADLANYQKQRAAGALTEDQYTAAVERLIQKQPFAIKLAKEQADAWKEQEKARQNASKAVEKAYEDEVKAAEKSGEQITNKVAQLKIEEAALALAAKQNVSLAQAVELVNIKRLEELQIIARTDGKQELVDALQAEIEARKELATLTGRKETRDAGEKAAKEAASAWEKTEQDIEKGLTDALMRGFEGGKDAAQNMRDTIVNMFKTMVLRPVISAIVQPVSGAITGALGLGSGAAQAAQGNSLLGGIGNLASLAGPLGSMSAGFTMATSGITGFTAALEGGVAMLGSATGFGSAMAGIGQLAGALGPVALGVAALASIFGHKATPHMGAVATATGTGVSVARATEAYGGFNADMSAEMGAALSGAAKSVKDTLDAVSKLTGAATTQYEVLLSYADDTSKDAAWGNLIIKRLDGTMEDALVEWSKGREGLTPKAFADGEQGYKDFMKAVAQDTKTAIEQMDGLPKWMERLLKSADTSKIDMDTFAQLMQAVSNYPNLLLEKAGTSRDALVQAFAEGAQTSGAVVAGQNVANMLVASVEHAVYTAGMGQVFDIVNQGIVTPMLDAFIAGQAVSDALSQQAIDETIARATAAATALGTLMNSAEFQGALAGIKTAVGDALGQAGAGVDYAMRYQLPAATELTKAADEAAKAAEDARKKWQDITDALLSDKAQLNIDLLRAQGKEEEALAQERAIAIKGYDDYQIALYDANKALEGQIALQERLNALHEETSSLEIDLMRAQGKEAEALAAQRAIDTKGMTGAEIALYDHNRALEHNIAVQQSLTALQDEGATLQIDLLRALGREESALAQERAIAIKGMGDLEIAQYDANQSTRKLIAGVQSLNGAFDSAVNALASPEQKLSMGYTKAFATLAKHGINVDAEQVQQYTNADLLALVGYVSQLGDVSGETRTEVIGAIEAIGALNNQALDDLKTRITEESNARIAAWEKEKSIAEQRASIEQSALQLLGNTTALRQRELDALDATNQALQQRIWAVEDASAGVDKALALVQRSIDAEKKRITDDAQAQIDAINAGSKAREKAVSEAQKAVQDLDGLFNDIMQTVKTLRGNVDEQMRITEARAFIDMSLAVARAGGAVNAERLSEAMQTVTTDTDEAYAAGADFRFAQKRQAAVLEELGGLTGGSKDAAQAQLDAAENAVKLAQDQIDAITKARDSQLAALDAQLKSAQDAVSVMRGVDISVIGVDAAVQALDAAIEEYEIARDALAREQLATGHDTVGRLDALIEQERQATIDTIAAIDRQAASITALGAAVAQQAAAQAAAAAAAQASAAAAVAQAQASAAAASIQGATNVSVGASGGAALDNVGPVAPVAPTTYTAPTAYVSNGGPMWPSFDVGTNYVPRDMIAQIHEGEAIVPKEFNPAAFGNNASNAELTSLVAALTSEVKRLQGIVQEGNREQRRTADAVNGQPEAPMLVETVL